MQPTVHETQLDVICSVIKGDGSGYSRVTGVTGSGYEYTASVDQDSLTCSVEYEGTNVDIDEGEYVVDASQSVTIQILNIDGEDTVMAELTFPVSQED